LHGHLTLGGLLVFVAYLRTMQNSIESLAGLYTKVKGLSASVDRVLEVLDTEEEVADRPGALPITGSVQGHVRFESVTFGYEAGRPVLRGVDLEAHPGETV